jgi:hypothetical protein
MRNAFQIMMMMPQVKSGNGERAWDDFQLAGAADVERQRGWSIG